MLYSVGAHRTDDCGQRVSLYEATTEKKGDVFLDASTKIPEEAGDGQPEVNEAGSEGEPDTITDSLTLPSPAGRGSP